jgi:SAM-dependent methyltransferase
MAKLHINENILIKSGSDAEDIFRKQNDTEFLSDDGIIKVTQNRWALAQSCETKHWMRNGIDANDDRNFEHCRMFNNYSSLNGLTFEKAIEFGCGPFTNIRIIADIANIESCILLDPLIDKYLDHGHCRYASGELITNNNNRVKIGKLLKIPGEQISENFCCDLVVCVNVLEHCYDAKLLFDNMWDICSDGGYLVFHDKLFSYEQAKHTVNEIYDAAHPLRVGRGFAMSFLSKFETIYEASEPVSIGEMVSDFVYFIGRKRLCQKTL